MKQLFCVLIIIFASFFTFSEFPNVAYGTFGCDDLSLEQAFYNSHVVFSGKIISTDYVDKYKNNLHPSGAEILFDPIYEQGFLLQFENGTSIPFDGQYDIIQLDLDETFKGYLHQKVILKNNLWTAEDPYYPPKFIIGEEYIVFAKYYDDGLGYSTCSPNLISNSTDLILLRIYSIFDIWTVIQIISVIAISITFGISVKKFKTIQILFKRTQK